jgi:HAD superfamily hydrolase (TIGR01509 family)
MEQGELPGRSHFDPFERRSCVIRALVFDFDGLILDTEVPIFQAWAELYAEHGVELELALWQSIIGTDSFDPVAELERRLGRTLDWAVIDERRRQRRDELQALEAVRPGILDWLAEAKRLGLPVGIASSSPRQWVVDHLDRLGLVDQFSCIRCRDDVGEAKPSPASYRAVLDYFGVAPSEGLAVEDSVHGVAAAKAAGMRCVAVPGPLTRGMDFSGADLVLDSLDQVDLADVLTSLG